MNETGEWVGNDWGTWSIQSCAAIFSPYDGVPLDLVENEHFLSLLEAVHTTLWQSGYRGEFDKDLITVALEDVSDSQSDIILTDGGTDEELIRLKYQG